MMSLAVRTETGTPLGREIDRLKAEITRLRQSLAEAEDKLNGHCGLCEQELLCNRENCEQRC